MPVQAVKPMTIITFLMSGSSHTMIDRIRKNVGKQITISMNLEMMMSTQPPM